MGLFSLLVERKQAALGLWLENSLLFYILHLV